jgi:hypothetical protein
MATIADRRAAAEILRRIVATLPEPAPIQVAFLLGQASALDPGALKRVESSRTDVSSKGG